ncbi:hypothetical protein [Salinimicrobium sediminilitoris]|uniref:hypothetical protein n=1 Tax=Salinimicrobium sediminilitoris TaxID=2876715 RepID=UPI001E470D92|nr:hypothetical protein [Salinimicrobium sediminilitoris]MCC8358926.1 hypothetical protein [Salinimicrobium sediminilitoris]
MNYYTGAYYFIKLKPVDYGTIKGSKIFTCSRCINDSYFDDWAISWATTDKKELDETKAIFSLTDKKVEEIQTWADKKLDEKKLGWINTFSDLKTLTEYKEKFFPNELNFQILSISFPESELDEAIELTQPPDAQGGEMGIHTKLKNKEIENSGGTFLGFDIIGIEVGGDFHSFHCHDLSTDLKEKFGLTINEFGLIENFENWDELMEFMNDESNGFEPVPWFYVKVNQIKNKKSTVYNNI